MRPPYYHIPNYWEWRCCTLIQLWHSRAASYNSGGSNSSDIPIRNGALYLLHISSIRAASYNGGGNIWKNNVAALAAATSKERLGYRLHWSKTAVWNSWVTLNCDSGSILAMKINCFNSGTAYVDYAKEDWIPIVKDTISIYIQIITLLLSYSLTVLWYSWVKVT